MSSPDSIQPTRFVGIDLHKHYVVIGAVDSQQRMVLSPCRVSLPELSAWQAKHLQKSDAVVVEATANAWTLYDQLVTQVASVTVAHPLMIKLITAARVKTDAHDTIKLARLLAGGLIPAVWVPPVHVRELRGLVGPPSALNQLADPSPQSVAQRVAPAQHRATGTRTLCRCAARMVERTDPLTQ